MTEFKLQCCSDAKFSKPFKLMGFAINLLIQPVLTQNNARKGEGGLRTKGLCKTFHIEQPLLSILVAVFNGAEFIEDTITSVLSQDYSNIELIIVDGGSTDGTQQIIKKYEHVIDYWVSEPDKGISDAFNKAVLLATGDYVNFQGAGDYLCTNNVVTKMLHGINSKRDMLICGKILRVTATQEKKVVGEVPKKYKSKFKKISLLFRMSLPHQALFTHKKMFEKYGLFDIDNEFCMDYEHLLRAYRDFPNVILKDVTFSAWREGGIGTGRMLEILNEYNQIKQKNNVAPKLILKVINYYILFKYYLRKKLNVFRNH